MTQVHVQWGNELETFPSIEMAARKIKLCLRLRRLDAVVMGFWDSGVEKPARRRTNKQKTTQANT